MEKYRLSLDKREMPAVVDFSQLNGLVERVLVVDMLDTDTRKTDEKTMIGVKLVGILMRNNPLTALGVRFKEDAEGEHLIGDRKYRKLDYDAERLVLNADEFPQRDIHYVCEWDKNYQTSHVLRGLMG